MKRFLMLLLCAVPLFCHATNSYLVIDKENCTIIKYGKTFPLYGKVKIVDEFEIPDITVKIVDEFEIPDIKVKIVDEFSFADSCGEIEFVDSFGDITVKIVDEFEIPDLTVKIVDSFGGF